MDCMVKFAVTLLLFINLGSVINAGDETGWCYYFNDPHLIPFPAYPGAPQDKLLCQNNCTEILVKNEFVEIFVTVDPTQLFYPIVDYTLIFFATPSFPQPCVITDSIANPSPQPIGCQSGSPALTSPTTGPTQYYFHLSENIRVDIDNRGSFFNIGVTQSFDLIGQSTGLCVNPNCDGKGGRRKKRQTKSDDTITRITQVYIDVALKNVFGEVSDNLIKNLQAAVIHDLKTTFQLKYAETIPITILRDSVKQYQGSDKFQDYLNKADSTAQEVNCQADEQASEIINTSELICNGKDGKERECLQSISCTGGRK